MPEQEQFKIDLQRRPLEGIDPPRSPVAGLGSENRSPLSSSTEVEQPCSASVSSRSLDRSLTGGGLVPADTPLLVGEARFP